MRNCATSRTRCCYAVVPVRQQNCVSSFYPARNDVGSWWTEVRRCARLCGATGKLSVAAEAIHALCKHVGVLLNIPSHLHMEWAWRPVFDRKIGHLKWHLTQLKCHLFLLLLSYLEKILDPEDWGRKCYTSSVELEEQLGDVSGAGYCLDIGA